MLEITNQTRTFELAAFWVGVFMTTETTPDLTPKRKGRRVLSGAVTSFLAISVGFLVW